MARTIYQNVFIHEQTLSGSGTHTITFPWPTGRIIIANDDNTNPLTVKLNADATTSDQEFTLKAGESFDMEFRTQKLTVAGNSIPHRVWAFG